jgi:MFS family permease
MWSDPALRHMCIGATLLTMFAYTVVAWVPSYLIRSHGLGIAAVGIYLAAVIGVGGAVGTYLGGWLSDRLRSKDIRWSLWLVTAAFIIGTPLMVGFYLAADTTIALALFAFPAMVTAVYFGPSIAVLHDRVPASLRPVASAIFLLIITLIGLGIGPVLAGAISQYLFIGYGADSLRYALLVMQTAAIWGAFHYYLAGRSLASPAA